MKRLLPLLLVLFVGSGCAALVYEIVWFQLLELVIGSSAVSMGVLLGTFMGGMCIGSLALPRFVGAERHPLRVYALLEAATGLAGLVILFAMPLAGGIYTAVVGHGLPGILLRGVVCAVLLLPPTIMMGATLPAIARWVETSRRGVSWLGFFYGGNTAGAVLGALVAGFYLLRVHDMAVATYVAVAINGAVALIAFAVATRTPGAVMPERKPRPAANRARRRDWPVYAAIALSGFAALGAEVVWTRVLSLMLGATVYTFSIILAVFLTGIGLGSGAGAALARGRVRPRVALGVTQFLSTLAIAWAAVMLARSLPYWPIRPSLSTSPWYTFQLDLVRCLWAVLPAACLWGASFPLALAAAAEGRDDGDAGRLVGGVYAANTVGAIAGAIGFSLLVIPWLGTQGAERLLVVVGAAASVLALALVVAPYAVAGAVLAAGALAYAVPAIPGGLIAYGRALPDYGEPKMLYVGEGINASIAVSELPSGVRNFHVSGKVEASTEPQDMKLQRMLGHLPALVHPNPQSVLVVGFGAGVTAGSFVLYPSVKRIVICEIEPLIPRAVGRYFSAQNYDVVHDPRVEIVYDDARHYILTTRETFDIITSDPIHPWVKGAASLYTKEYFELVKRHLNPGGVVTQWVPLYESNAAVVKSELATFFDVFPNGTVWGNTLDGKGYDTVLLGQAAPTTIDLDALHDRLFRPDHLAVTASLNNVGFYSLSSLLGTYAGSATDLAPWLVGAEINRDRDLRLQYLAGLGLNLYQEAGIYDEMLVYRRFPTEIFRGSAERMQAVREEMR